MTFSTTVREAREARGFSREQVARRLGFTSAYLVAMETARTPPPGDTSLVVLANVLRLDPATLVREALAERAFIRLDCAGVPQRELAAALLLAVADADAATLRVLAAAVKEVGR